MTQLAFISLFTWVGCLSGLEGGFSTFTLLDLSIDRVVVELEWVKMGIVFFGVEITAQRLVLSAIKVAFLSKVANGMKVLYIREDTTLGSPFTTTL